MEPTTVLMAGAIKAALEAGAGEAGKQLGAVVVARGKELLGRLHPLRHRLEAGDLGDEDVEELAALVLRRCGEDPGLAAWLRQWLAEARSAGLPGSAQDFAVLGPPQDFAGPGSGADVPRSHQPDPRLPAPLRIFVNRHDEQAQLTGARDGARVVVVSGRSGIGKTSLVVRWLSGRVAGSFAAGCHYLDLDQLREDGVVSVGQVAQHLLREIGTPEPLIPTSPADLVAAWAAAARDRELCLILDNVRQPGEVEPLVPASRRALVVAIGAEPLAELLGSGAASVPVGPFDAPAGRALLAEVLGTARVADDPDAVDRIIEACDGIPVVLAVAAGMLAGHADRPAAWLADLLRDDLRQLAALRSAGRTMVERVFDATYADLPPESRLVYRALGRLDASDFRVEELAALAGQPVSATAATAAALSELAGKEIVQERFPGPGYRVTRLIWLHAQDRARAEGDDTAEARDAARRRHRDWIVATVQRADAAISAGQPMRLARLDLTLLDLTPTDNPFDSSASALSWIEEVRPRIMATLREASRDGDDLAVIRIADGLWPYFTNRRPWDDFLATYRLGIVAARRLGNAWFEARMRCLLSRALRETLDLGEARMQVDAAAALVRGRGGREEASVLEFVGLVTLDEGQPELAYGLFDEAKLLHIVAQNRRGEVLMTQMCGRALDRAGAYERAERSFRDALRMVGPAEERLAARLRLDLAETLLNLGRGGEAAACLTEALPLLRAQLMTSDLDGALTMLRSAQRAA
jgi:tetratricopeptide (TPR) repeat protein